MSLGSFDRAASFYDQTRGLPPAGSKRVADVLAAELADRGRCIEIGVGTGRIALPLHGRGVKLVGTDVAAAMLARLVENAGGRAPFALVRADATALPFADASFGAVLASHVLHLIPDWTAAVDEAWRVLRPGGALLVDFGGDARAPWSEPTGEIFRRHGIVRSRPGVSVPPPVAAHVGSRPRPLPPIELPVLRTLGQDLAEWEQQIHSWTWPYSAEQMAAACAAIRSWAREAGRSLDEPTRLRRVIQWWAFDHPR